MPYSRETIPNDLPPGNCGIGGSNPYRTDAYLCDPCGLTKFPTDQSRYDHPDRWVWAPWANGAPCAHCGDES